MLLFSWLSKTKKRKSDLHIAKGYCSKIGIKQGFQPFGRIYKKRLIYINSK